MNIIMTNQQITAQENLKKLQEQSKKLREVLKEHQIVIEKNNIKLVMNGNQQVIEFSINGVPEQHITEVITEACQKTQEIAAQKMIEMTI